jgi:hypothetical protein
MVAITLCAIISLFVVLDSDPIAIQRTVAKLHSPNEAASMNSRYPTSDPEGGSLSIF